MVTDGVLMAKGAENTPHAASRFLGSWQKVRREFRACLYIARRQLYIKAVIGRADLRVRIIDMGLG
jgi:hypothetical protein